MADHIAKRLHEKGPKRILALDGGGVRGLITIGFLEEIEALLRKRYNDDQYVLADYFDLIGGTSVGSMVATMLALGWPMEKVRAKFNEACPEIFGKRAFLGVSLGLFVPKFYPHQLEKHLNDILGDMTLGSDGFKTGLAIVAKRVDESSTWVLFNNPSHSFWNDVKCSATGETETIGNGNYKVADLIRASTAAPTYFKPHPIRIHGATPGRYREYLFVDGGLSPHNDPSLLLFMMAGIRGYRLGGVETAEGEAGKVQEIGIPWKLGEKNLLMVSVGCGSFRAKTNLSWRTPSMVFGGKALLSLISDNQAKTLKMMQWLSKPNRPWTVNGEVGDLSDDDLYSLVGAQEPMLSYARYDVRLEESWLEKELDVVHISESRLERLRRLDNPNNTHTFNSLAKKAAAKQVKGDDFPGRFDRPKSV
jgi:hypothetical protein